MSNPEVMWSKAFAWNATNKNTIQDERQSGQAEQDANLKDGFPLITMTPKEAGGIAPNGQDMNGIIYSISTDTVHRQKGERIKFDPAYAAKIGGYSQGAILQSNDKTREYISLIPNNLTDPNGSGTAGRWAIYAGAGSIASATASIAGIVKIVDNLSSNATDAALTANQGRVLGDRTQQATVTNVGISRFANATEISGKSNNDVAINPRGVANMFESLLSPNGWLKFPDGTIVQWVTGVSTTVGDADFTINFPIAFPTACLHIMVSTKGGAASQTDGIFQERSFNRTSCVVNSQVFGTGSISSGITPKVFAIGY